jgi:transposase
VREALEALSHNNYPVHSRIADFRKRHMPEISRLFVQVPALCREADLVNLGHVAPDGTKIKADASKRRRPITNILSPRSQTICNVPHGDT